MIGNFTRQGASTVRKLRNMPPGVAAVAGVPGSGKTTWGGKTIEFVITACDEAMK
jgi:signal recognition particle GTPase